MNWLIWILCALVGCWLFWTVARLTIQYTAGQKSLRISLAGFKIRRIKYEDITRLSQSTAHVSWFNTEHWSNTSHPQTRSLVIHRRTGLLRRVLITPKHREIFRDQLATAIRRSTGNETFDTEVRDVRREPEKPASRRSGGSRPPQR